MPQSTNPFYPGSEGIAQQDYFSEYGATGAAGNQGTPTGPTASGDPDAERTHTGPELRWFRPIGPGPDGTMMVSLYKTGWGAPVTWSMEKAMSDLTGAGYSPEEIKELSKTASNPEGVNLFQNEDGSYGVSYRNANGSYTNYANGRVSQGATPYTRPAGGGGAPTPAGGGGTVRGGPVGTGGPTLPEVPGVPANPGSIPPIGGAPGGGGVDPNAPLTVNDPGASMIPGRGFFTGDGGLPNPGSIFNNLPPNPTLADIIGAVTRRQEAGLDTRMNIFNSLINETLTSPESQGLRANINRLLQNPESMDEATMSRMIGQGNEQIAERGNVLAEAQRARAASMGTGRDQGEIAANATLRNTAGQQSALERSTRIQGQIQNAQDIRSAIGAAGAGIAQDQGMRQALGRAASDAVGESQVVGDAFLTNTLFNRGGTQNTQTAAQPQLHQN